MANQSRNGAAFEYICAMELLRCHAECGMNLRLDSNGFGNRDTKWRQLEPGLQDSMRLTAKAVAHDLVANNQSFLAPGTPFLLRVGDDARNMDVRDLVIYTPRRKQQLGVSLKWNSDEIKSMRLSLGWHSKFGVKDASEWTALVKTLHRKLAGFATWSEAKEALGEEYIHEEYKNALAWYLGRIADESTQTAFINFLFGVQDYEKYMAFAKRNTKALGTVYSVNRKRLPACIKAIEPWVNSNKKIDVLFGNWTLTFRLHNKDDKMRSFDPGSGMSITVSIKAADHHASNAVRQLMPA